MLQVAAKESVELAQSMHQFIWGIPCGPTVDMTKYGPVNAYGYLS